jgi:hypothetical protein
MLLFTTAMKSGTKAFGRVSGIGYGESSEAGLEMQNLTFRKPIISGL